MAILEREAERLPTVSREVAEEYGAKRAAMVELVDRGMEAERDIVRLIGGDQASIMRDNHRHHAAFLYNVLRYGHHALLARTLPWVYRAYRGHGFSMDYFLIELEHWKRAVAVTLSSVSATAVLPLYDWMIGAHERVLEASLVSEEEYRHDDEDWVHPRVVFLHFLLEGDARGALGLAQSLVHTPSDYGRFCVRVLQPAMYEIGRLWETGRASVAQEHLASAICGRLLAEFYPRLFKAPPTRGPIVITAAPNEFHELGARMTADLLELDGWDTRFLGANTPIDSLVDLLLSSRPRCLGVSLCLALHVDRFEALLKAVRDREELSGLRILGGGRILNEEPAFRELPGLDGWAPDALAAVELARAWDIPGQEVR